MPNLTIPKKNVIGFSTEPPFYLGLTNKFINYARKYIGKYYIGDLNHNNSKLKSPFVSHIGYIWHAAFQHEISPKVELMSIIFSNKKETPGQKYRHTLVTEILNSDLPIHIFGRGCRNSNSSDERVKGSFEGDEPYKNYKFTSPSALHI